MNFLKTAVLMLGFAIAGIGLGWLVREGLARADRGVDVSPLDRAAAGLPAAGAPVMISLSTCPVCKEARRWLAERGVEHTELVVDESTDARALADRLGVDAVPVFLIGEQQIVGFDPALLESLLGSR